MKVQRVKEFLQSKSDSEDYDCQEKEKLQQLKELLKPPEKKKFKKLNSKPLNPDHNYVEGLTVYKTPLFSVPEKEDLGRGDFEIATVANALGVRVPVYPAGYVKPLDYSSDQDYVKPVSFVETSVGLCSEHRSGKVVFEAIGFGREAVDAPVVECVIKDWKPFVLLTGHEDSDYVQVDICRDLHSVPTGGGGLRGEINKFSRASRKRMLDTLCKLRASAGLPQFATLTYPGEFPHDSQVWKVHLDLFGKRLVRAYPGASAVWKLEPQARSAPHYHLIIYGVPFDQSFKSWLSRTWYEVVGSGDERHLRAGTNVQPARSLQGVKAYASKRYMGKELSEDDLKVHAERVSGWASPGRFWGVLNRSSLPMGKQFMVKIPLNDDTAVDAVELVRSARLVYRHKTGRNVVKGASAITLYVSADQFRRLLPSKVGVYLNNGAVFITSFYSQWSRSVQ